MLFPDTGNKYAVVDPFREDVNLPKVIVPVYPEVGDFVSATGQDEEFLEGIGYRCELPCTDCWRIFLCKTFPF